MIPAIIFKIFIAVKLVIKIRNKNIETYIQLLDNIIVAIALHALLIINTYFLLSGEKYYNENVGVE